MDRKIVDLSGVLFPNICDTRNSEEGWEAAQKIRLTQSMNSLFRTPYIGVEPRRLKRESLHTSLGSTPISRVEEKHGERKLQKSEGKSREGSLAPSTFFPLAVLYAAPRALRLTNRTHWTG